ncbi:hypothetical protein KHP62_09690 [Rhodobacteraceae bacterium NNCM2]|nr:hypothetical protein [Coraliihabitans acroporae]
MTRVVHFLLHVPKCAGTTVERHFSQHLGKAFLIAPRWDSPLRDIIGNRYPGVETGGLKVVSGHSLSVSLKESMPGAEIRESVLLRDPIGYFLSFYNYRWTRFDRGLGPKPPSLEGWYRRQRRNPISRFLITRYFEQGVPALYRFSSAGRLDWLEERLERFHFVGSYRRANEMIAGISRELSIPDEVHSRNVSPGKHLSADELDGALADRILEDNALDVALYDRWASRGWDGAPMTPRPKLPGMDQPRYAAGDLLTGLAKRIPY